MRTIFTCGNLAEVAIIRSLLSAENIEVWVPNENTPQPLSGFPSGYQIQVSDEDQARALSILQTTGYVSKEPDQTETLPRLASPCLSLFRFLVFVDAVLAIGLWIQSQHYVSTAPSEVQHYFESLAASIDLWGLGYDVYKLGFGINLIGALLLFFRTRTGLWLYVGGLLLEVLWVWVFPGGITYGLLSVLGAFELLLAGFIVGFAMFEKTILGIDGPLAAKSPAG